MFRSSMKALIGGNEILFRWNRGTFSIQPFGTNVSIS